MIPFSEFQETHHESNLIGLIDINYNLLCSHLLLSTYSKRLELLAFSLAEHFRNFFLKKIYFTVHDEPFTINVLNVVSILSKLLINKYNINIQNLAIVTSVHPCQQNGILYEEHCKNYDWAPIPLYSTNHLEYEARQDVLLFQHLFDERNLIPNKKQKKFLSYNRSIRFHRICMLGELLRRDLFDKGYISFLSDNIEHDIKSMEVMDNDIKIFHDTKQFILNKKELFPIELSIPAGMHSQAKYIKPVWFLTDKNDINLYNNTYFSIITETNFFKKVNPHGAHGISFSEKTFKAIQARHPFVLLNAAYSLKYLKELGYKTFHPFINESYDNIQDDEKRLIAIMDEVERLCNLTDDEWVTLQYDLNEIVDFNYRNLMSKTTRILYDRNGIEVARQKESGKHKLIEKHKIIHKNGYQLSWVK